MSEAGVEIPDFLPLLDHARCSRETSEVVDRLLVLTAIAAVSYGFEKNSASPWLIQEDLVEALTPAEASFLADGVGSPDVFKVQVEGAWALAWAINLVVDLDFRKPCDSGFVRMVPNLRVGEASADWYARARMRTNDEIIGACDLAYCLHWAVRNSQLAGLPPSGGLIPFVVVERRRALGWLLDNVGWDEVQLDT